MTRGKIDTSLKWLDELGFGTSDGDAVRQLQPPRGDALLALVALVTRHLVPHRTFSSALDQIKDKLRGASDRIESVGHMGSNEVAKVVSGSMDNIRAAIVDCQVSSEARTGSTTEITNEHSLFYSHPARLVNRLLQRRGPVSDATS